MDITTRDGTASVAKVIIAFLEQSCSKQPYTKGDSIEDVAYKQAQLDLTDAVRRKFLGE
jgi:hypothetical protein